MGWGALPLDPPILTFPSHHEHPIQVWGEGGGSGHKLSDPTPAPPSFGPWEGRVGNPGSVTARLRRKIKIKVKQISQVTFRISRCDFVQFNLALNVNVI